MEKTGNHYSRRAEIDALGDELSNLLKQFGDAVGQQGKPEDVRLVSGGNAYALENTHEFLANLTKPELGTAPSLGNSLPLLYLAGKISI